MTAPDPALTARAEAAYPREILGYPSSPTERERIVRRLEEIRAAFIAGALSEREAHNDAKREAEIRARVEAATRGPWKIDQETRKAHSYKAWNPKTGKEDRVVPASEWKQITGISASGIYVLSGFTDNEDESGITVTDADAVLIANAPSDLAYCLSEISRLRMALEEAQKR